jgi:hypothetical protein
MTVIIDLSLYLREKTDFMPTPEEITAHHDIDPDENPFVHGKPPVETIKVVPYDPAWPALYQKLVQEIGNALGDVALKIDHVGSTAVPSLPPGR